MTNPGRRNSTPPEKQQGKTSGGKKTSPGTGAKAPSQSADDGYTVVKRKSGTASKQKAASAAPTAAGGKAAENAGAAEVRPTTEDSKTSQDEKSSSSSGEEESDDDSDSHSRHSNNDDNNNDYEEGQLSKPESRGVASDILGAHVDDGHFGSSRLQSGSGLEKFVIKELETAVRENSNPHPVVLQLALGTSALHPGIAQLAAENQALMERVDKLEEALQHKTYASSVATKPRSSTAKEHAKPRHSVKFADQRKPGSKQGRYSSNNKARGGGSSDPVKKRKANVSNPCDFFLCRGRSGRFTHSRSECDYIRQVEEGGVQLVRKP